MSSTPIYHVKDKHGVWSTQEKRGHRKLITKIYLTLALREGVKNDSPYGFSTIAPKHSG